MSNLKKCLQKWNYQKHIYEPYNISKDWNCKTYSNDLNEIINCPHCGKELKFGDSYTSLEIHTNLGFGYGVCEKCYNLERLRRENDSWTNY